MLSSKMDKWYRVLNILALICAAGTLIAIYNAYRTLRNRDRGKLTKITESAIALACIGYIWILIAGNLVIFNLNY
jgi:hypothetical protein